MLSAPQATLAQAASRHASHALATKSILTPLELLCAARVVPASWPIQLTQAAQLVSGHGYKVVDAHTLMPIWSHTFLSCTYAVTCTPGNGLQGVQCIQCTPGSFGAGGQATCQPCLGDQEYSNAPGAAACSTCGTGVLANATHTGCGEYMGSQDTFMRMRAGCKTIQHMD